MSNPLLILRSWLPVALCAAVLASHTADAQNTDASPSAGSRVGPKAEPLPTPSYATPSAPILPPSSNAPSTQSEEAGSEIVFGDVRVAPIPIVEKPAIAKNDKTQTISVADVRVEVQPHEALDADWVRRQFQLNGMVGQKTSTARIVALVLTINRVFLSNGYVNSGVLLTAQGWPAAGGTLELQLINGRIGGAAGVPSIPIEWTDGNAEGLSNDYVLERLPSASEDPLDGAALEREFRLLAEDPAIRTVNAQLNPTEQAGEATLSLSVNPEPRYDSYVSFADSRSPSVGGNRVAVGGSVRNNVTSGDLLSAELGETSGLTDATVGYSAPLSPDTGVHARFSADDAAVVAEPLQALGIHSRDRDWEIGVSHTLIAEPLMPIGSTGSWSPAESLSVGLLYAGRETASTLLGQPFSFSPGDVNGKSHNNVFRATADWVERGEQQVIAISGIASFGFEGSGSDVPGISSPNPDFRAGLIQGNYARRLNDGSLELHLRIAGQAASGLLYSGERLAVGGDTTVRGYRENLLLADTGAVGSIELSCAVRFDSAPCGNAPTNWTTLHASIFVDGAYVRNETPPQPVPDSIGSVGTSLTWTPLNPIFARVTYGYALNYVPPVGKPDLQDRGFSFEVSMHPLGFFQ